MSVLHYGKRMIQWAGLSLLLGVSVAQAAIEKSTAEFPYRSQYDVNIIETEDFTARLDQVVTVDVRSSYEFHTLHIKGAVNINLDTQFITNLQKLREKDSRPIVVYCNGKTCRKSYKAAALADKAGIKDVHAYDAGIKTWAETHPELTVLRGKSPMRAGDLISDKDFSARVLKPKEFVGQYESLGKKAAVLDIRDRAQRDNPVFGLGEHRIPLDDSVKLDAFVEDVRKGNKTLFVYDKAGHQIRWFQYYLREMGVRNFHFLKGGSEGYFTETLGLKELGSKEH